MLENNSLAKLLVGLIIVIHVFILTKLIFFPYPELFIYPYLTNNGLKPYSQILDQHFPGLMFLPINFDNLGMNDEVVARVWLIGVVILTHLLLFAVAKNLFKSTKEALLVNILYLIWQPFFEGWVLWIDTFLPLILLPAFLTLQKKKNFLTGLLLGIGVIFKQVLIPLVGLVFIYILWKEKKLTSILNYLAGVSIPIAFVIVYFGVIGVLKDFLFWTITFNLTTYAKFGRGAGPAIAHFSRVLFVFGLPFLILRKIKLNEVQLLIIFLIGALIGLSTRFDFVHFQPALPFALLATVFGLGILKGKIRLGVVCIYIFVLIWWLLIFYKGHLGSRVIAFDTDAKVAASKIRDYTRQGEKIFVFGGAPHLYQMSKTLPAGDIFVFQFPWFLQVAEGRILAGIKKDQPNIIIADRNVEIEGEKITSFAKEIDKYIQSNYRVIDKAGSAEILQKK